MGQRQHPGQKVQSFRSRYYRGVLNESDFEMTKKRHARLTVTEDKLAKTAEANDVCVIEAVQLNPATQPTSHSGVMQGSTCSHERVDVLIRLEEGKDG